MDQTSIIISETKHVVAMTPKFEEFNLTYT